MPKTFIAGILLFLKKQGVIKKTDETENKLFDELSKVFHITY